MSADAVQKGRLYHDTPGWVPEGETFHIRIRREAGQILAFTQPGLALPLLDSVRHYHTRHRWFCRLFLLMPDHLHALLAFPRDKAMSQVIKKWKSYHARQHQVVWQDGYFDHRIRNRTELEKKADYIRQNPVVKGLVAQATDWPWVVDQDSLIDG
jgi:REP element-mobilizing transposase RayT